MVRYLHPYHFASFRYKEDLFLPTASCCDGLVRHHHCQMTLNPPPVMAQAPSAPHVTDPWYNAGIPEHPATNKTRNWLKPRRPTGKPLKEFYKCDAITGCNENMNLCIASIWHYPHMQQYSSYNFDDYQFHLLRNMFQLSELSESVHWSSHITALCNCFADFKFTGRSILIKSLAAGP